MDRYQAKQKGFNWWVYRGQEVIEGPLQESQAKDRAAELNADEQLRRIRENEGQDESYLA